MAQATVRVEALCSGGTAAEITSGSHRWRIDEPPFFGGADTAPSPVQALLGALAGCVAAAGAWAEKDLGYPPSPFTCTVEGDCSPERFFGDKSSKKRAGFTAVRVIFDGKADWTPQQRRLWAEETLQRCPVWDNLKDPTQVEARWKSGAEQTL